MAERATVVGSGPNGLAAAVSLARAGYEVRVLESSATTGGGTRTAELTLPGFRHDVGSAVHPGALTSPFFRAFGLRRRVEWIVPEAAFAHPLDPARAGGEGRAAIAWHDLERTAEGLGRDAGAWRSVVRPLARNLEGVLDFTGHQLLRVPRHPVTTVRYGLRALQLGTPLGRAHLPHPGGRRALRGCRRARECPAAIDRRRGLRALPPRARARRATGGPSRGAGRRRSPMR